MEIRLDLNDFEDIYSYTTDCDISGKDIKEVLFNKALEMYVDKLYEEAENFELADHASSEISKLIRENKNIIIEKVVERITERVMQTKAIKDQMPKKSEIKVVDKEWGEYFESLVEKAIKKKFQ